MSLLCGLTHTTFHLLLPTQFADENFKVKHTKPGYLSMANAGPNTGGSQFFVNVVDNSANLDSGYPVFGAVIAGMDVVDKIAAVAVTPDNNRPLSPVTINSVTLK